MDKSTIDIVAILATLVTAAGVSIYGLGLIGLALPIKYTFTGDMTRAWYAMSLVPKTVVAGQGVWIWLGWPLFLVVLVFSATIFGSGSLAYVIGVCLAVFIALELTLTTKLARRNPVHSRGASVLFLGTLMCGGFLLLIPALFPLSPGVAPLLVVGGFLIGLPRAIIATPALPKVRISKEPELTIERVTEQLEGQLVAHSGGFWHLFVRAESNAGVEENVGIEEKWELLSIPDNKVLVVRMVAEEAMSTEETTPEEDTKLGMEKDR